jgi:glycosyltransferase involved in cell wall biosynthesis
MSKKPSVSILIASFNKEKFVKRCLNSCLKQDYNNLEVIFYDDGSKDNSYDIAKKTKGIKAFKNIQKKKLSKFNTYHQISSYNKALSKSKGEYILLLDSDDFFKKNKVKTIVEYFTKNPKSNIVFDLPIYYYSKSRQIYVKNTERNKSLKKDIWPRFPIAGSCISFRRKFYKKFTSLINNKNFSMLTLDFRLAVISNTISNDFKLLNKNLTFYFQDKKGESYLKFKKFSKNWWIRRKQAHDFMKMINKKNRVSFKTKSDLITTNFMNKIYNFL